jgi:hypothetical protein
MKKERVWEVLSEIEREKERERERERRRKARRRREVDKRTDQGLCVKSEWRGNWFECGYRTKL